MIVHYETPELLRECLRSLTDHAPEPPHEILVVDNSRAGEAGEAVCREFPPVRYLRPGRNLGFAGGINRGLAATTGRYVFVLNPDVVAHAGAVDALVAYMEGNPDVGIAGAKLLNPDGSLQHSCRTFYTLRTILLRRTPLGRLFPRSRTVRDHLLADWDHATERDVDWLLGACLLVRRAAVDEVGPADERFFLYFEDVDWCYRMHQRGWRVAYVPSAVVTHHHRRESAGGFTARGLGVHVRSSLKFYEKWSLLLYLAKKHAEALRGVGLLAADLIAVAVSFLAAYGTRALAATVLTKPLYPLETYTTFMGVVAAVTLLVFAAAGLYTRWRDRPRDLFLRTARAALTTGVLLMALTFVLSIKFSRVLVAVFVPVLAVTAAAARLALASAARRAATSGMDFRRVLTVGGTEGAAAVADAVQAHREHGYALAGHLDPEAARWSGETREGMLRRVLRAVRAGRVGDVVLVEPFPDPELAELLARGLHDAGVAVHLAPQWTSLLRGVTRVEHVAGLPLLALDRPARRARGEPPARAMALALASAAAALMLATPAARAALPPPQSAPGAVGWTTFLEPRRAVDVAVTGSEVWSATETGLRAYDVAADRWVSYFRTNGLPSDAVTAVSADAAGRVWMGTAAADLARLSRDGTVEIASGALFGLVQLGSVTTLAATGDSLWVGAPGGLALFRVGAVFSRVTLTDSLARAQRNVRDILARPGERWIATDGGVVRDSAGAWTDLTGTLPLPVTGLAEGLGEIWAIAGPAGLAQVYRRVGGGWTLDANAPSGTIAIAGDAGAVYVSTGPVVNVASAVGGSWAPYPLPAGLSAWSLAVGAADLVWAGTDAGGARLCLDCSVVDWIAYTAPGPRAGRVPDPSGPRITFDAGGQVWITTQRAGAAYYDGTAWANYALSSPPFDDQYWFAAFTDRDGARWFSDWGAGVLRVTGTPPAVTYETTPSSAGGLSGPYVMCIAQDPRGRLYFGHDNPGFGQVPYLDVRKTDGTWLHVSDVTVPRVWAMAFDASGRAWLAEKSGRVDVWDDRLTDDTADDVWNNLGDLPSDDANSVVIDGPRAWIGTTGGLARYSSTTLVREQVIAAPALPSTEVRALALEPGSAGRLWVGTAEGLAVVTRDGVVVDSFTTRNSGLVSSRVYAVAFSPTGELWVATADGFSRYTQAGSPPAPGKSTSVLALGNPVPAGGWLTLRGFTGQARATIYRLDGQRVRTIEGVEENRPFWDGRDAAGGRVPPGPYLVRLEGGAVAARVVVTVAP